MPLENWKEAGGAAGRHLDSKVNLIHAANGVTQAMVNLYHRSNFFPFPSFYVEMFHVSGHLKRPENWKRLKLKTVHGFTRKKTAVHFIHVRKIDYTRHCSILDRSKAIGF